jgi:transketolase
MAERPDIRELAAQLRVDSIRCSTEAGSGHPTSSLSAADLMAVLLAKFLRWDRAHPERPTNDHLIFSKGHASPLLYAMFKAAGVISDDELMSYRQFGSRVQGHPVPTLPFIDVATGSLGQGLPVAVGIALAGKYLERLPYRVWVLLGDSEMSEGSIWEAFDHARHYRLENLVAVLDMNRLGQRGETPLGWDAAQYAARARAFGWQPIEVDGHDVDAIQGAFAEATRAPEMPVLIVARTIKGKGVPALENKNGFHGKPLPREQAQAAIAALGGRRDAVIEMTRPPPRGEVATRGRVAPELPRYEKGDEIATRKAYGDALAALGTARSDVVALDGEVSNSTGAEEFAKEHGGRYFEMFIAEQQMVAAAVGLATRGFVPFASTFAAFLTRAYDFVRMGAVSRANIRLCGSHAGVSIGEDGPSQMGLEDLSMMRAVEGSTVLYPCCANQTAKLVLAMADHPGIVYLRTTRGKTAVVYSTGEEFPIGGCKVLRESSSDEATIIGAGITVHEALDAYERLREGGIVTRVLDAYSVKPLDADAIREAIRATHGRVIVVEDHFAEGGLGDAVRACLDDEHLDLSLVHLAVRSMPASGAPSALLRAAGIDAEAIAIAVRELVSRVATCYVCGAPASVRIFVAGEDEHLHEEAACSLHARGHREIAAQAFH